MSHAETKIERRLRLVGYPNGWTPQRDLMLFVALGEGAKLADAAKIAGVSRVEAKARWDALIPGPSLAYQAAAVTVARRRCEQAKEKAGPAAAGPA